MVGDVIELRAVIANAPSEEKPSYRWELDFGNSWYAFGEDSTFPYAAGNPGTTTFRVTVTYDNGETATSDPITVAWTEEPGPTPTPGPTLTPTPGPTPTPTPGPNRAPTVNVQAEDHASFINRNNAPRGTLVSKPFHGVFADPDGDELTYTVSVPADHNRLVHVVGVVKEPPQNYDPDLFPRVFFEADDDDDWNAVVPPLADPLTITVTLTATDPDGLSASVKGDFHIDWESHPVLLSAAASREAVALTFDQAVQGSPGPTAEQFMVNVTNGDGATGTMAVESVTVSGAVITLELAAALVDDQTVTLDYAHDDDAPLTRAAEGGDHTPGFTGQAVELSLTNPPGPPETFAVTATPGSLNLSATWDAVEDATSYKLSWRQADGNFEPDNEATVSGIGATITVSDYGQWVVQLESCNDAGCGPEASQTVELSLLDPPTNFEVSATLGQLHLRAKWDAVEGATFYRLLWRQSDGGFEAANTIKVADTSATITVSDYGEWEVRPQACNDGGCVPATNLPADETPAVQLSLEPGDGQGQVGASSFTATQNPEGDRASYTLGWRRAGSDPQVLSRPADAPQTRAVGSPSGTVSHRANSQTDITPPRLERGEIDGDTMTFYFSEPLDEDAVGAQFRITLYFRNSWANFTAHPRKVEISGNKVVVVGLSYRGWPGWERADAKYPVQAHYYKDDRVFPASERLQDLAGNEVPDTRTIWLDNLTAPPLLQQATAHPHWLTLTFNKSLDGNSVPTADAFTVTVNDSVVSLGNVEPVGVSGDTVTLVLASPVASTDVVTVSYAPPANSPLRGLDGTVKSFPGQTVTNLVGLTPSVSEVAIISTPADGDAYAPEETIRVKVTFTEAVTVTGAPRLRIGMAPNDGKKWANYEGGSGTTELTFAYTVMQPDRSTRGVAVLRDTLDLNGGTIRSVDTQRDASLWHAGLDHDPAHMVEWQRSAPGVPWVSDVAITSDPGDDDTYALGNTIQVTATFSEAVNVDTAGGMPRLKIKMDPSYGEKWANYAGGSGTTTLMFAYTVVEANHSTQGVAVLGNTLELNGSAIRSATATAATDAHLQYGGLGHDRNHRVDGTKPVLQSVAVGGTAVSLTFSEVLDEGSVPPASAFTVKRTPQGGTEETVDLSGSPVIAAGAVILTLANPVLNTDTNVTVSYNQPATATNRLKDKVGNEAASFTDQAADTTPPRLVDGEVDGDRMTLYFSEALDENSVGGDFMVRLSYRPKCDGPGPNLCAYSFRAAGQVKVKGNTVTVGFGDHPRVRVGQNVTMYYRRPADPSAERLRDLAGNPVSTPYESGEDLITQTLDLKNVTTPTSLESAMVNRHQLTLIFDVPLDEKSVPATSAFTTKVNGDEVSLAKDDPVTVAGATVTLTLASEVVSENVVTVSYAKPAAKRLRNVVNEDVENFSDQPVANNTSPYTVTEVAISSSAGADHTYGLGDEIQVWLTFSKAVAVTGTPRLKIKMDPSYGEEWANYKGGSGTTTLMFAYTVVEANHSTRGVAVLANTLELNGGGIRSTSSSVDADLRHGGLTHDTNHQVDGTTPSLRSVAMHDTTVTLTFSEAMDEESTPTASAFTVKRTPQGGTQETVGLSGSPVIRGTTVILTLVNPVLKTDTDVTVSYAKPASGTDNKLRDKTGNEAEGFTDRTDDTPARLVRAEVTGSTMSLYFSEVLDEEAVGGYFYVNLQTSKRSWDAFFVAAEEAVVEISGKMVVVDLGQNRARVGLLRNSVRYIEPTDPTAAQLRDFAGNAVGSTREILLYNGGVFLQGSLGDDKLHGGDGDDQLHAYDGNDQLYGYAGDDQLYGHAGNDELHGGHGADRLDGGSGSDTANYSASSAALSVNLTTGAVGGGHAQGDTLVSIENIVGSDHDDTLTGSASANVLQGRGGNDALDGRGGNDTLHGNDGNDTLRGGHGADRLDGGSGSDTADYSGSNTAVTVNLASGVGSGGDAQGDILINIENLTGSTYGDSLTGNSSANVLDGGMGSDTADYSGSNAAVTVNLDTGLGSGGHAQADTLISIERVNGSIHDDHLTGDASGNILSGNAGDDTLHGGASYDILFGGEGDDTLHGGTSSDTLFGGEGDDTLYGGNGPDVFRFLVHEGFGSDTIEDLTLADSPEGSDQIILCRKFLDDLIEYQASQPIRVHADVGSDHLITVKFGGETVGTITLKGVTSSSPNFGNLNFGITGSYRGKCFDQLHP